MIPKTDLSLYGCVKRIMDVCFALGGLILFLPAFAVIAAVLVVRGKGRVFDWTPKSGRYCRTFRECAFAMGGRNIRRLPVLLNVLKGDMSFVGPRAVTPTELCVECRAALRKGETSNGGRDPRMSGFCYELLRLQSREDETGLTPSEIALRKRNSVRPGLVCLWWIRQKASLACGNEMEADVEYVEAMSFSTDVGILLRALPAMIWRVIAACRGHRPAGFSEKVTLLGIHMDNLRMDEAVVRIMGFLDEVTPRQVCFVNPQCVNVSCADEDYRAVLDKADLVLADGIGMRIACKILHRPLRQNVNGTDMFPILCKALSGSGKGVYLLGAEPGVAEEVRDWMHAHYEDIDVKGCRDGFFSEQDTDEVVNGIAKSGADLLLVAMGVPMQELWIRRNLERTGVAVAMGVGGLFNFYSGRIPRAPLWVREIGMEWFHRFCQEPSRMWKRYFVGNTVFLCRVFRESARHRADHTNIDAV